MAGLPDLPPELLNRLHNATAVLIANLKDTASISELEEVLKFCAPNQKLYLVKEKHSEPEDMCFAFVKYEFWYDATKVMSTVNETCDVLIAIWAQLPKCPWNDTKLFEGVEDGDKKPGIVPHGEDDNNASESKNVAQGSDLASQINKLKDLIINDTPVVRINNLCRSTTISKLEELVRLFGPFAKVYLAKDEQTDLNKCFALVKFELKDDATKAIGTLNGYSYADLILTAEWSKPQSPSN